MATCPYCEKVEKDLEGFKPWVENHNNAVLETRADAFGNLRSCTLSRKIFISLSKIARSAVVSFSALVLHRVLV